MRSFHYRALRPTGNEVAGDLIAADERDAAARLQQLGSYPIEIRATAARRSLALPPQSARGRLGRRDLLSFTRRLSVLLDGGVNIDRALSVIGNARGRVAGPALAVGLHAAINSGESLSRACANDPRLPPHFAMIIAAGEARGDIAAAFNRLAGILERSEATSRALSSALVYPVSVLAVAFISISFLLGFVVPRFEVLLTGLQKEPPLAMSLLLTVSKAFQTLTLPAVVLGLGFVAFVALRQRDQRFRLALHRAVTRLPLVGSLIEKIEAERVLYLLGNLLSAGVPLSPAVAATRGAVSNRAISAALAVVEQRIERGDAVVSCFAASAILPEVAIELIRVGEETGDLQSVMLKAADVLRREFEETSAELVRLITPISIILLGLLIGGVAAAVFGSIMQVYDLAL